MTLPVYSEEKRMEEQEDALQQGTEPLEQLAFPDPAIDLYWPYAAPTQTSEDVPSSRPTQTEQIHLYQQGIWDGNGKRTVVYIRGRAGCRQQPTVPQEDAHTLQSWARLSLLLGIFCMLISSLCSVLPADTSGQNTLARMAAPSQKVEKVVRDQQVPIKPQVQSWRSIQTYERSFDFSSPLETPTPRPNAPMVGSGNWFPYGQCTYWANLRYHYYTGVWVPWNGNAEEWATGARRYGWAVSETPTVPSIVVFQRFVQGASGIGHVAVVESLYPDGSVLASNWNWNGNWDHTVYSRVYPGPGILFVSYPQE